MAQSGGDDLVKTLKDTPGRVMDALTLGPQRRQLSKFVDDEETKAENYFKQVGKRSTPKPAVQQKQSAKRVARKRG